jgi:splicing suppressor protein 51
MNLEDLLGMINNSQKHSSSYLVFIVKLIFRISFEPYCYFCFRRESQLEVDTKLNMCQYCLLTSFCDSCKQTHPSEECATLQDIATDDKVLVDLHRRMGTTSTISISKLSRRYYCPLSSAADWYDYYTKLSDMGGFVSKMDRDLKYQANDPKEREYVQYLRCSTNTMSFQLTLIAALEATILNIGTRVSINLHIIGASWAEFASLPAFEEVLHVLPSLETLQISFVGPNVLDVPESNIIAQTLCCTMCTKMGRSISISVWKGPYHEYIDTTLYRTPDLAAAFHSGFSVDEQADWRPTITYLAHAPHPTLFTAGRSFEILGEIQVWNDLRAEFIRHAEVHKWKGMSPSLVVCGDKPNEVTYRNHRWYIVKHR